MDCDFFVPSLSASVYMMTAMQQKKIKAKDIHLQLLHRSKIEEGLPLSRLSLVSSMLKKPTPSHMKNSAV